MEYRNLTFNNQNIRTALSEEDNEWYFSVVDVIRVITDSEDPSQYLRRAKSRNQSLATFTGTSCTREALLTVQGMKRTTSVISKRNLSQFLSFFSSEKKEEFNTWLESNFPSIEMIKSQNSAYLPQKSSIRNLIYTIDNVQFMLDSDLAELFQVDTGNLNKAMKRNIKKFPENFCFQLTCENMAILNFQIGISSLHGGTRKLPYAYTEHGILMLATVLHSDIATEMSVRIIQEFVEMRHFLTDNNFLFNRLDSLEKKQLTYEIQTSEKFEEIFDYMHQHSLRKDAFFSQGTYYDSYSLLIEYIQLANESIILIDNYVDLHTLNILSKKKEVVSITLITHPKTSLTNNDINQFNQQYPSLIMYLTDTFHDRYLILDHSIYYTMGQSFKDVGKKNSGIVQISDSFYLDALNEKVNEVIFTYVNEIKKSEN